VEETMEITLGGNSSKAVMKRLLTTSSDPVTTDWWDFRSRSVLAVSLCLLGSIRSLSSLTPLATCQLSI